jgi:hypothetical protein
MAMNFKTGSLKMEHGRNKTIVEGDKTVVFKGNSQKALQL